MINMIDERELFAERRKRFNAEFVQPIIGGLCAAACLYVIAALMEVC